MHVPPERERAFLKRQASAKVACSTAALSRLVVELGAARYQACIDLICMRIRELRLAKREGGSWEKASALSLMPGPHGAQASIPDQAFTL